MKETLEPSRASLHCLRFLSPVTRRNDQSSCTPKKTANKSAQPNWAVKARPPYCATHLASSGARSRLLPETPEAGWALGDSAIVELFPFDTHGQWSNYGGAEKGTIMGEELLPSTSLRCQAPPWRRRQGPLLSPAEGRGHVRALALMRFYDGGVSRVGKDVVLVTFQRDLWVQVNTPGEKSG